MTMRRGSIPDFHDYAGKGIDMLEESLRQRPYRCRCGASFSSLAGLEQHYRIWLPHPDHGER